MAGKRPHGKQWGDLSQRTRNRYAREGERLGLNRRQQRAMFNRGTWNPGARDSDKQEQAYKRLPDDVIRHPEKYPQLEATERDIDSLREKITDRLFQLYDVDDPFSQTSRGMIVRNVGNASPVALVAMDRMTDAELKNQGSVFQVKNGRFVQAGKLPHGLTKGDVTYTASGKDGKTYTYSIFWYHSGSEANDYI